MRITYKVIIGVCFFQFIAISVHAQLAPIFTAFKPGAKTINDSLPVIQLCWV
ncbi:hypothetical protein D3C80_509120 [compost metagenome]